MKTIITYAVAFLATFCTGQEFNPAHPTDGSRSKASKQTDQPSGLGDSCRVDDDCTGEDLVCAESTCIVESGESDPSGGFNGGDAATAGIIPAGDMCQPGQMCEGDFECPSCFVEPCTCPENVETAVF